MPSRESERLHQSTALRHTQADRLAQVFDLHLGGASPALASAAGTATRGFGQPAVSVIIDAIIAISDQQDPGDAVGRFDALRHAVRTVPGADALLGRALVTALADCIGAGFSGSTREAWADGYVRLVETVMAARRNRFDLVA